MTPYQPEGDSCESGRDPNERKHPCDDAIPETKVG
jgi:hypothetical protein